MWFMCFFIYLTVYYMYVCVYIYTYLPVKFKAPNIYFYLFLFPIMDKSSVIAIPIIYHVAAARVHCNQELLTICRAREPATCCCSLLVDSTVCIWTVTTAVNAVIIGNPHLIGLFWLSYVSWSLSFVFFCPVVVTEGFSSGVGVVVLLVEEGRAWVDGVQYSSGWMKFNGVWCLVLVLSRTFFLATASLSLLISGSGNLYTTLVMPFSDFDELLLDLGVCQYNQLEIDLIAWIADILDSLWRSVSWMRC